MYYEYLLIDMVVSGIPISTPFHAREIADMSIDLVRACEIFNILHMPGEPLKIRVGLHSGKFSSLSIKEVNSIIFVSFVK
jgi:hypothetical protein